MYITQIKTIERCNLSEFDKAVNEVLSELKDEVLNVKFASDEAYYIAHIIYQIFIKD